MAGGVAAYRTLLEEGIDLDTVTRLPRRHPLTYRDTVAPGKPSGAQLPANPVHSPEFTLHIGPAPKQGQVLFLAAMSDKAGVAEAEMEVTLNGATCTPLPDAASVEGYPGAVRAVRFECPLAAVKDGYNAVRISTTPEGTDQELVWAELQIRP